MLLRHTFVYGFAKGVPGIIVFVSLMIFSRMMSPEEYGRYSVALIIVNVANAVLFQWLRLSLIRFMPATDSKDLAEFKGTISLGYLSIVLVTAIVSVIGILLLPEYTLYISISVIYLWLLAWFEMNQTLYRTKLEPLKFGFLTVIKTVSSVAIGVVLLYLAYGAIGPLVGLVIGTLLAVFNVSRKEWKLSYLKQSSKPLLKMFIIYGLPLTITFAMAAIIRSSDRLLLSLLVGIDDAGLYALASDFSQQTLLMFMMIVNLGAAPIVIRKLESEGVGAASKQLSNNLVLLAAISIPATLGIICLTENIGTVFFGEQYVASSIKLIPIVIIGAFFAGLKANYFDVIFQLGKKTTYQLVPVLVAAIVSVGSNLLLIPALGTSGAALSSLIAYSIALLMSGILARRIMPIIIPWRSLLMIILAGAVMVLCLIPVLSFSGWLALTFQVGIGFIAYVIVLFAFNFYNMKTIVVKQVTRKLFKPPSVHAVKKEGIVKDEA